MLGFIYYPTVRLAAAARNCRIVLPPIESRLIWSIVAISFAGRRHPPRCPRRTTGDDGDGERSHFAPPFARWRCTAVCSSRVDDTRPFKSQTGPVVIFSRSTDAEVLRLRRRRTPSRARTVLVGGPGQKRPCGLLGQLIIAGYWLSHAPLRLMLLSVVVSGSGGGGRRPDQERRSTT